MTPNTKEKISRKFVEEIGSALSEWDAYLNRCIEEGVEPQKKFEQFIAEELLTFGALISPFAVSEMIYYISAGRVRSAQITEIHYNGDAFAFGVETPFVDFVLQEQDVFRDPKDAEKVLEERKNDKQRA